MTTERLTAQAPHRARLRARTVPAEATCAGRWMRAECEPGLVSVIIPTYNRADLLLEALNSVRAQTYRPIDLIVVDDGGTDRTGAAVARWVRERASDGLELRYFRQRRQGAPVARNRGLIESRGQFILFLDSDDLIGRTKLAASVARLRGAAPLTVVHGPWRCRYSRPIASYGPLQEPDAYGPAGGRLHAYIAGGSGTPLSAYVFPRALACAVGPWDEGLLQRQDTDYVVRAIMAGCTFVSERRSVVVYRRHGLGHIGHPANFRRHFPSQLALADKWRAFIRDGLLPADAAPALRSYLVRLLVEARIAGNVACAAECRRRLSEWFGERRPDGFGLAADMLARRLLLRPLRMLAGEMPLAYAKLLAERIAALLRPAHGG